MKSICLYEGGPCWGWDEGVILKQRRMITEDFHKNGGDSKKNDSDEILSVFTISSYIGKDFVAIV